MNRCKVCGGKLFDDRIGCKTRWRDRTIGIEGISALVCTTCGQAYVRPSMAVTIGHLNRPVGREDFLKNPVAFWKAQENPLEDGDRL